MIIVFKKRQGFTFSLSSRQEELKKKNLPVSLSDGSNQYKMSTHYYDNHERE